MDPKGTSGVYHTGFLWGLKSPLCRRLVGFSMTWTLRVLLGFVTLDSCGVWNNQCGVQATCGFQHDLEPVCTFGISHFNTHLHTDLRPDGFRKTVKIWQLLEKIIPILSFIWCKNTIKSCYFWYKACRPLWVLVSQWTVETYLHFHSHFQQALYCYYTSLHMKTRTKVLSSFAFLPLFCKWPTSNIQGVFITFAEKCSHFFIIYRR